MPRKPAKKPTVLTRRRVAPAAAREQTLPYWVTHIVVPAFAGMTTVGFMVQWFVVPTYELKIERYTRSREDAERERDALRQERLALESQRTTLSNEVGELARQRDGIQCELAEKRDAFNLATEQLRDRTIQLEHFTVELSDARIRLEQADNQLREKAVELANTNKALIDVSARAGLAETRVNQAVGAALAMLQGFELAGVVFGGVQGTLEHCAADIDRWSVTAEPNRRFEMAATASHLRFVASKMQQFSDTFVALSAHVRGVPNEALMKRNAIP